MWYIIDLIMTLAGWLIFWEILRLRNREIKGNSNYDKVAYTIAAGVALLIAAYLLWSSIAFLVKYRGISYLMPLGEGLKFIGAYLIIDPFQRLSRDSASKWLNVILGILIYLSGICAAVYLYASDFHDI